VPLIRISHYSLIQQHRALSTLSSVTVLWRVEGPDLRTESWGSANSCGSAFPEGRGLGRIAAVVSHLGPSAKGLQVLSELFDGSLFCHKVGQDFRGYHEKTPQNTTSQLIGISGREQHGRESTAVDSVLLAAIFIEELQAKVTCCLSLVLLLSPFQLFL